MEEYTHPFASIAPGILLHTDLPEIGAQLGARLLMGGSVDGRGAILPFEETKRLYASARVFPAPSFTLERLKEIYSIH